MYQTIIIGCGFAGAAAARELAEKDGQRVLIIDERGHIGGNCYDTEDEYGILVHRYGPHIFHTNIKRVYDYLSRFTKWLPYQHEVVGNIYGEELPVPFNLNALEIVFKEQAEYMKKLLIDAYGEGARVPILNLRESKNLELRKIAEYVYENIFLKYTMKQWGQKPEDIDPSVSGRVPVLLSYDNRYFQDEYQGMPKNGYRVLFENMLDHPGIDIRLNCPAKDVLSFYPGSDQAVLFEGKAYDGTIIYTGALDELFGCQYGRLPYRSLRFKMEHYEQPFYQSHAVVNYTVTEEYTRITEYKYLSDQLDKPDTTIMKEYPIPYQGLKEEIPYYAINNPHNQEMYEKYKKTAEQIPRFHILGRLAEYKYYNIDAIVDRAITLTEELRKKERL
ncbi:MAG: UDP-galactopyranose mutase [Lachnoclostridium sp.]|jgi:UDP-galactopyranose mutase|nr:UDP-galactopyranose mutase [Lachnoclostridium sp.]